MIVTKDGTLVGAHMGEIHQEDLDAIADVMKRLDVAEIDIGQARELLNLI